MSHAMWRMPGYRVEALLGSGSSGEVWRAVVPATGVAVALKRLRLPDPAARRAALAEAAILRELDHPHLVKLHDVRHQDDDLVLVLDLAAGGSLADLLARRGRLTVGETITALAPIGAALAHAHGAGVVHGDVSGANVLFTEIGLPLLADLGVARLLGDDTAVRTTPAYSDPVVASGAVPFPASDLFMLGAVALHALTGSPPWTGDEPAAVFANAASGDAPDFASRLGAAHVPGPVAEVVLRALELDPLRRGTAADFALDLRAADTPVAVELTAGRARPTSPEPAARAGLDSWGLRSTPLNTRPPLEGEPVPFVGAAPLTAGVRAPAPFASAPSRRARRGRHAGSRLAAGLAASLVLLGAIVGVGAMLWPSGETSPPPAAAAVVARDRPAPASGARVAQPSRAPSGHLARVPSHEPSGAGRTARATAANRDSPAASISRAQVGDLLARLDRARGQAYARRDPRLLRRVYASPALLARDGAQLLSTVPNGCSVDRLRSRFGQVRIVDRGPRQVTLRASVAVGAARLTCAGMAAARLRASRPVALGIVLAERPDGYRIVAEHRVVGEQRVGDGRHAQAQPRRRS